MKTQIFCTECNAAIEQDSKFCPECGTKVEEMGNTEYDHVFCPNCGEKTTTEFEFCPECGKSIHQVEGGDSIAMDDTADNRASKSFKIPFKPLLIGIGAVVLLVVMIGIFTGNSGSKGGQNIIYAKDKALQFTYLPKLKNFEMTDKLINSSYDFDTYEYAELSDYTIISDDGRYIFYPDRIDNSVTYYWRDLKADNSKSDAAVKIDSDISKIPFLTSNGNKFFYVRNDDNRLYVFDRKSGEKNKLDDDVYNFYVDENGDYIIYEKYSDGEYSTYEMMLKGISGEKNKIDSNARIYAAFANEKKVYYQKDESLYMKEFNKDKVKIVSDVEQIVSVVDGKSVYYLKAEEVTNKLSTLINDDMAASDKDIKEPEYPVMTPEPVYPVIYDYKHQVWYAASWGREFNSDTNEYGYWQEETDYDTYYEAYEKYEEEYSQWQLEHDKIMDKYNEDYAIYRGKDNRDDLRLALDDEENSITYKKYSLYYWNNGTENLVATDLANGMGYRYYLTASSEKPVVIYQKYSTSTGGSQKLSEIVGEWGSNFNKRDVIWDMKDRILAARNISDEIYVASGEKESIIESDKGNKWSISKEGSIYFLDNYNMDKSYGTMMSASIKDGAVQKPVKIDEDVMAFFPGNENGNYYYFKDMKNNISDLYLNGKLIASDVYIGSLYNYRGTDILIYFTDFSTNNDKGDLCILKGGKQTKISSDVSFFSAIDEKNIAYLTDYSYNRAKGDLMLYNGGSKPVLIDSDVTAILWNPSMMWWINYY